MSQTAYAINIPAVSYPGQIADDSQLKDVLSAAAYAAALAYGILVVTDESNTVGFDSLAARSPSASDDITTVGAQLGVVLADQARAQNPAFSIPTYSQGMMVPCMRFGRVWVLAETAMADGANPYIRYAAGTFSVLGSFRNSADTSTAAQMAAGQAVVRGTTTAAGYAVIELNIA